MSARIVAVFGNLVIAEINGRVVQNSLAYCLRSDGVRLMSEVIRVRGRLADLQVFEETRGLAWGIRWNCKTRCCPLFWDRACLAGFTTGCRTPCRNWPSKWGFSSSRAHTSMVFLWNSRGISRRSSNPVPWSALEIRWGRSRKASSPTRSWFLWLGVVNTRSTRSPLPDRTPSRSKSRCWPGPTDSSIR